MKAYSYNNVNSRLKTRLKKETPRWFVLLTDIYLSLNTFVIAFLVLKYLNVGPQTKLYIVMSEQLPQVFFFTLAAFLLTSSYKGVVRHTGFRDVMNVLSSNFLYLLMIGLFNWILWKTSGPSGMIIGKAVLLVHFLFNTMVLIFLRILYKNLYNSFISSGSGGNERRVMIYGAGDSGIITFKALKGDEKSRVRVCGFIDDNRNKVGNKIDGVRIYNPLSVDRDFIEKHDISEIIVSIQGLKPARLNEMVDQFSKSPVTLKIVPAVSKWLDGDLTPGQIKKLNIEDLLGREPIRLDKEEILQEIRGKTVMVTGAAGSIGSEIARQLMGYPCKRLILIDQAETPLFFLQQSTAPLCENRCAFYLADIRNPERMEHIMDMERPDIVFHAAAYKHVPMMEENPYEGVATNVKGTKIVADLAVKYRVKKFVMVSTDKAVNPTNVMGATKRIAELYATWLNGRSHTQFIVTRFGNVLGSNGSVIPIFKKQIEEGGPLTVTHTKVERFFMTIPEACQLVLEAGAMGKGGEVYVFDMGESVRILDLAQKLIRLSGLNYPEDIQIKITGLRPGEKIKEELLSENETLHATHHPKIMIADVNCFDLMIGSKIEKLISLDMSEQSFENKLMIVSKIKEIVPEYNSRNSVFSMIDRSVSVKVN